MSGYNISSPRYKRENHYAILARQKISQVSYCKMSITLLISQNVVDLLHLICFLLGTAKNPDAKLVKISESESIIAEKRPSKLSKQLRTINNHMSAIFIIHSCLCKNKQETMNAISKINVTGHHAPSHLSC